jgi:hypothetical protein
VRELANDMYRAMKEAANTILFKFSNEIENFKIITLNQFQRSMKMAASKWSYGHTKNRVRDFSYIYNTAYSYCNHGKSGIVF